MTVLLDEILQAILLVSAYALPVELFAAPWRWPLLAYFVAAEALLAVVRLRSRRVWQFLLPALALLAAPAYAPYLPASGVDVVPRLVLGLGLAAIVVRAAYLRWTARAREPAGSLYRSALAFLVLIALDAVAVWREVPHLPTAYFLLGVAFLALSLVRWHRYALGERMARYAATPTQPAARVVRGNRILLAGSLAGTTALLLLSPLLAIDRLLPWLGKLLLALLRWLIALIPFGTEPEPTPTPEPTLPTSPTPTPEIGPGPAETPAWLQVLSQILLYAVLALLAIGLAAGVGYGVYRLYRRFYEARLPDRDVRESLLPNLVAQVEERVRAAGRSLRPPFARTPEERIRQAMRRLVASQVRRTGAARTGDLPSASATARALLGAYDADAHPELREALALYEMARYGPGKATPADAARMNRLVRALAHRDLRPKPPAG